MSVLQRQLVGVVEKGKEHRVFFTDQLLPLEQKDAERAAIELTVGFDAQGPYLKGAKLKDDREILFINQRMKQGESELRVSHKFFEEERFDIDFSKFDSSLHVLNKKPSAWVELVDMVDTEDPTNAALGLELCLNIREAAT